MSTTLLMLTAGVLRADTIPDFPLPDIRGQMVKLSDYRGKVVLLEFWASWCGPCRASNPDLVHTNQRFAGNGFEILGVSTDKSLIAWQRAVEEDQLPWTQLIDQSTDSMYYADMLNVQALPHNFLIDRNGEILRENVDIYTLDKTLALYFSNETGYFPDSTTGLLVFRQPGKYVVSDMTGKKIKKGQGKEIDLYDLTTGQYLLKHAAGLDTVKLIFKPQNQVQQNTLWYNEWGYPMTNTNNLPKGTYYTVNAGVVEKKIYLKIDTQ